MLLVLPTVTPIIFRTIPPKIHRINTLDRDTICLTIIDTKMANVGLAPVLISIPAKLLPKISQFSTVPRPRSRIALDLSWAITHW